MHKDYISFIHATTNQQTHICQHDTNITAHLQALEYNNKNKTGERKKTNKTEKAKKREKKTTTRREKNKSK